MIKYREYEELHEHKGNEKYEIVQIIAEHKEAAYIHFDTIAQNFVLDVYYEPVTKKDSTYETLKISKYGAIKDTFDIHSILKNGTMWDRKYHSNWIINGDTTKQPYLKPFSNKDYEPQKWLTAFKQMYDKASASYYFNGIFYLKIDNQWNEIDKNFEIENFDFDKHFPDKYADIRMVELKDHTPDFSRKAFQRDTSLWTYHGYEEANREEGVGLNPINFSAGWHYLQLKMPDGKPLKIKRYGSMGANLHTYIIPGEYGGRQDIVFIVQEPSSLYPDREHGGMYVVRPRELGENTGSLP